MKQCLIALVALCFSCIYISSLPSKPPRILMLIIASDDAPHYVQLQKLWRTYMHSMLNTVSAYFIKARPDLSEEVILEGDTIWTRGQESLKPGIIQKTIKAFRFAQRLGPFDYIIRTNLSSFYHLARLTTFCSKLPRRQCYAGMSFGDGAISGAGMILSYDLVKRLSDHRLNPLWEIEGFDDTLISQALLDVSRLPAPRLDVLSWEAWEKVRDVIPSNQFHFRFKNKDKARMTEELSTYRAAISQFYPNRNLLN